VSVVNPEEIMAIAGIKLAVLGEIRSSREILAKVEQGRKEGWMVRGKRECRCLG
jgi:hypothetical protein